MPSQSEAPRDGALIADLRNQIAKGQLMVVVGAGVSVGATTNDQAASWRGLLHNGAQRAQEISQRRLPDVWREVVELSIDSGDLDLMLSSAELVTQALGGRSDPEFARWLRESVGSLRARDRSVLEALVPLAPLIATSNYDGLLEEVSGWSAVTWRDSARMQRVLRGDEQGILHLHGHYEDPQSVVLGIRSYGHLLADAAAQAIQRAISSLRSLAFIGYGGGLADPNFGSLRSWLLETYPNVEYRHFRFCLDDEFDEVVAQHPSRERVKVVPYGRRHEDLAPFLRSLAPTTPPAHVQAQLIAAVDPELDSKRLAQGVSVSVQWPDAEIRAVDRLREDENYWVAWVRNSGDRPVHECTIFLRRGESRLRINMPPIDPGMRLWYILRPDTPFDVHDPAPKAWLEFTAAGIRWRSTDGHLERLN
jgi:hypothetical protein